MRTGFVGGPVRRRHFFRERDDFRRGTFAPFSRASFKPIAIACLRLFTFRPEPLFSVPFIFRCIADLTRLPAARPYLAMSTTNASVVLTEIAGWYVTCSAIRCDDGSNDRRPHHYVSRGITVVPD